MNCCVKCYKDEEIKAIIAGMNVMGNCDFCYSKEIYVLDINKNNDLSELFEGLLEIYTPVTSLPDNFPKENLSVLRDILYSEWNIFNLDRDKIYKLITTVCSEKYAQLPELFDSPVGIFESIQEEYLENYCIVKTSEWDKFVNEIKYENRFHTNFINTNILYYFLQELKKDYVIGEIFYRARISQNSHGFSITEMGAPPKNLATSGRINPEGISCLYLSDTVKTTLHETRAGVYDYVTVGEFNLLKKISVINLGEIDKISPFRGLDFTQLAINIKHLHKISDMIAKPVRRHDSSLDYLPTQYISDFIKRQGYDGIEYASTMNKNGYNLAIFNEGLLTCQEVTVYDIDSLNYGYNETK